MARTQKTKAKPASRRKRIGNPRKAAAQQSQNNWRAGVGFFALAAVLGAGAYMLSVNLHTRTTVAELVEHFEVPAMTKEQMPSAASTETEPGSIESAPTR